MSKFERQMREDKLLRDAAQELVKANVERVKGDLEERGLGQRALGRAKDGAAELFDRAKENGGATAGIATVLLGAIGIWLAREPLLEMLNAPGHEPTEDTEDEPPTGDKS